MTFSTTLLRGATTSASGARTAGVATLSGPATCSDLCISGKNTTTAAPTKSASTIKNPGFAKYAGTNKPGVCPEAWNGALMPISPAFRRGTRFCGSFSSTGAASIFRARHTLEASARTNTASKCCSSLSASKASSFFTGTFMDTASAATCRPAASRAARNMAPAVNGFVTPLPTDISDSAGSTTSFIKGTSFKSQELARLRKPLLQLHCQLRLCIPVLQLALYFDSEPQRLRIGGLTVVQPPCIKLRAL